MNGYSFLTKGLYCSWTYTFYDTCLCHKSKASKRILSYIRVELPNTMGTDLRIMLINYWLPSILISCKDLSQVKSDVIECYRSWSITVFLCNCCCCQILLTTFVTALSLQNFFFEDRYIQWSKLYHELTNHKNEKPVTKLDTLHPLKFMLLSSKIIFQWFVKSW